MFNPPTFGIRTALALSCMWMLYAPQALAASSACGGYLRSDGERDLTWSKPLPIVLSVSRTQNELRRAVQHAVDTWGYALPFKAFEVQSVDQVFQRAMRDGMNAVTLSPGYNPGVAGEAGYAALVVENDKIVEGDVVLYPDQFQYAEGPTDAQWDLHHILQHELGHLLGLADADDPGLIMFKNVFRGPSTTRIGLEEIRRVRCHY